MKKKLSENPKSQLPNPLLQSSTPIPDKNKNFLKNPQNKKSKKILFLFKTKPFSLIPQHTPKTKSILTLKTLKDLF
jgi:hypothetical protein